MDNPYDSPGSAVALKHGRSFRCFAGWSFIAGAMFVGVVFLLNLVGCSLYLYINMGMQDLIFGGSIGVSHIAISPHVDAAELYSDATVGSLTEIPGYWHTDILKIGPFHLFAEPPPNAFQPFRFYFVNVSDYTVIEFPLLLTIAVLATLGGLLLRGRPPRHIIFAL